MAAPVGDQSVRSGDPARSVGVGSGLPCLRFPLGDAVAGTNAAGSGRPPGGRCGGGTRTRATRRIAARPELAGVHVVILTPFELDEYVFEGLRAGAAGFLVKDTDAAELIRAVRVVAGGAALLAPTVTRRLIAEFASRIRHARTLPGAGELTPREREVVVLIALGCPMRRSPGRSTSARRRPRPTRPGP